MDSADSDDQSNQDANDTLTLERHTEKGLLLSSSNAELCFQSANFDAAKALHDDIWSLASKYYALPFPDACANAANSLEALYPALQKCSADADCTYVGLDFEPIAPDANLYVSNQSGTKAQPLIVANLKALNSAQSQLQAASDSAASSCDGSEMYATGGFYPGGVAPVCTHGACQVPQSLLSQANSGN